MLLDDAAGQLVAASGNLLRRAAGLDAEACFLPILRLFCAALA